MSQYMSLSERQQIHSRPPPAPSHHFVPSKENAPPRKLDAGNPHAPPWSTSGVPPWSTTTRPLSDIRELTEPSLAGSIKRQQSLSRRPSKASNRPQSRAASVARKSSSSRAQRPQPYHAELGDHAQPSLRISPNTPGNRSSCSSLYSIPLANVPPRSTSKPSRHDSVDREEAALIDLPPARGQGYTISNHGRARSPVKEFAARFDAVTAESERRVPSRTFRRAMYSTDVLDEPCHRHPRVSVDLNVNAPLFVGGGSIEGHVRLNVDDAEPSRHKRAVALGRVSVDLLGVEEMTVAKRSIFLNLATELVDAHNPPPRHMVESTKQLSPIDPFWLLVPSVSSMPFILSLPLDVGPPPFQSKHARIRYVLCVTLLIRDQCRQYLVRSSQDVSVLSVFDPEKALMSLPSPLTAVDEYVWRRENITETLRVTAGLHRQVWVSGTNIFVDVHIANHSRKSMRRLEIQLERDILSYKHAAAATLEKSASQARIFDSNERAVLTKSVYKQGVTNSFGVPPHATETRTYNLELPRGHATVKCGKFFEVRYFLNIIIGSSHSKFVTVQLPIVLIHMNSLDVVPNSVAEVAAAIEEKRATAVQTSLHAAGSRSPQSIDAGRVTANMHLARKHSLSVQGRAFAAPRMQSLERMRLDAEVMSQLGHILDSSPRRYAKDTGPLPRPVPQQHIRRMASSFEYHTPPSNRKGRVLLDDEREEIHRRLRHVASVESNKTAMSAARARNAPQSRLRSRSLRRRDPSSGPHHIGGFQKEGADGRPELSLGLEHSTNAAGISLTRRASSRTRNFQFPALGRSRSQSRERWKAQGWFDRLVKREDG